MPVTTWISVAGVVGQLVIGGVFLGEIRAGLRDLVKRSDRCDARVDTIELRLNDHTERISYLEGRLKGEK